MKVLVTGGAGYIGSCLVQELVEQNHQVLVVDNLSTGYRESIPSQVLFKEVDILDSSELHSIFAEFRPEVVFHLAAKSKVAESFQVPELYYENNVTGSLQIARLATEFGIKALIFSSTAAVYGEVEGALVDEQSPLRPVNPYGRSKLMAEQIFWDCAGVKNIPLSVLRYFNVAGAKKDLRQGNRNPNPSQVIEVAALSALSNRPFTIFGTDYPTPDGSAIRDFIHVEDLVNAHILALEDQLRQPGKKIFNCGYGKGFSVMEVAEKMRQLSQGRLEVAYAGRRQGDPSCVVADSSRIKNQLKWRPQFDELEFVCLSTLRFKQECGLDAKSY